jgi:lysophospholipase L1-like esterase
MGVRILLFVVLLLHLAPPSPGADTGPGTNRRTIAILGSSVAAGWVTSRDSTHDMGNGWAQRFARALEPRGYDVVNVSVPGDNTVDVLERIDEDLLPLKPEFVIVSLNLSNEGILDADPDSVVRSYKENLRELVRIARKNGIVPVLGLCYPNDDFTDLHHKIVRTTNLELQRWDVPCIDFLGPLDDGSGGFQPGYTFDFYHPDDLGHLELYRAVVPSLFEAIDSGKSLPDRFKPTKGASVRPGLGSSPLSFVPEDPMHSFTVRFEVRTGSPGIIAAIEGVENRSMLEVKWKGKLTYLSTVDIHPRSSVSLLDTLWHDVILVHQGSTEGTRLYVDGEPTGAVRETFHPLHFVLGGPGPGSEWQQPDLAEYRNWMIYRTALNEDEVRALREGQFLGASLEIYAPLSNSTLEPGKSLENLAQSTSRVVAYPGDLSSEIDELRAKLEDPGVSKIYVDSNAPKPIRLDPKMLSRYEGTFRVDETLTLSFTVEDDELVLNASNGARAPLIYLGDDRFLTVLVGPRIELTFVKDRMGVFPEMIFSVDGRETTAARVKE